MLNEIGVVSFIGAPTNSSPPNAPSVYNLEWDGVPSPEIQDRLHITAPNSRFSVGGCGIDSDNLYHIYFVAEDDESPPNRYTEPLYR